MSKLAYVALMGSLVSATIPMVMAVPQEAPSAEELVKKMVVSFETDKPTFTRIQRAFSWTGGGDQQTWDVWSCDKDTFKARRHDGTLLIWTKAQIGIYVPAAANVAFVIPKKTIEKAGDELPEWLKVLGVELPGVDIASLRQIDIEDAWSLPDEDARAETDWPASDEEEFGEECWILTLSPAAVALLNEAAEDDAFTTDAAHIAIGKDTGYWRGAQIALRAAARDNMPMTLDVRVPIITTEIDTKDADSMWQELEGAKVIHWTPGSAKKTIGRFREALDRAVDQPVADHPPPTLRIVEPKDGAVVGPVFTVRVEGPPQAWFDLGTLYGIGARETGSNERACLGLDGKWSRLLVMGNADFLTISCTMPGPDDEAIGDGVTVHSTARPPGRTLRITEPRNRARVGSQFTVRVEGPPNAEFGWSCKHAGPGVASPPGTGRARIGPDGTWSVIFHMPEAATFYFSCGMRVEGRTVSDEITVYR